MHALDGVRAAAAALADHAHAVGLPQPRQRLPRRARRRRPGVPAARSTRGVTGSSDWNASGPASPSPISAHRPGRPSDRRAAAGRRSAAPAPWPARAPGARCARARTVDDLGVLPRVARSGRARAARRAPGGPPSRRGAGASAARRGSSSNHASAARTAKPSERAVEPAEPAREVLRRGLRGRPAVDELRVDRGQLAAHELVQRDLPVARLGVVVAEPRGEVGLQPVPCHPLHSRVRGHVDRGRGRGARRSRPARCGRAARARGRRAVQHGAHAGAPRAGRALPRLPVRRRLRRAAARPARRGRRQARHRGRDAAADDARAGRARRARRGHLPLLHGGDERAGARARGRAGGAPGAGRDAARRHARPGDGADGDGAAGRRRGGHRARAGDGRPELPPDLHRRPRHLPPRAGRDAPLRARGEGLQRRPRVPRARRGARSPPRARCSRTARASRCSRSAATAR